MNKGRWDNSAPLLLLWVPVIISLAAMVEDSAIAAQVTIRQLPVDQEVVARGEIAPNSVGGTYQQIFSSALFASQPPGPIYILDVELYASYGLVDQANGFVSGITVELSTTSLDVSSLSPVLANNVGADNLIFVAPTTITKVDAGIPGHLAVPFTVDGFDHGAKGFYYDPSQGNLLIQIKGLHLPGNFPLDAVQNSALTRAVWNSSPGQTTGQAGYPALVVGLSYFPPVPEPAIPFAVVSVSIGLLRFARRSSQQKAHHVTL